MQIKGSNRLALFQNSIVTAPTPQAYESFNKANTKNKMQSKGAQLSRYVLGLKQSIDKQAIATNPSGILKFLIIITFDVLSNKS